MTEYMKTIDNYLMGMNMNAEAERDTKVKNDGRLEIVFKQHGGVICCRDLEFKENGISRYTGVAL